MLLCLVTQSCPTLCDPMDCSLPGSSVHGDSPGKNTGVGCHFLLQAIFPTQGLNQCLLHWQADSLHVCIYMSLYIGAIYIGSDNKESAWNMGDPGSIPGSGRFPEEGIGYPTSVLLGFPGGSDGKKNLPAIRETWVWSLGWKIPWRSVWQPTPVFLLGESPWTEEPGRL